MNTRRDKSLDQFKVTVHHAELLDGEALKKIVPGIFKTLGVPDEDALLGADVLVRPTSGE